MTRPWIGRPARAALAVASLLACGGEPEKTKPEPPATVKTVDEASLGTLVLSEEAVRRLGIETSPAAMQRVESWRIYGGELTWPGAADGHYEGGAAAHPWLAALPPTDLLRVADQQLGADGQLAAARLSAETARRALEWAEHRYSVQAGSRREVEDARAQAQLADAALRNAEARRALLGPAMELKNARPQRLWIRVPVYGGDAALLREARQARVYRLGEPIAEAGRVARALPTAFSTGASGLSADLLFELAEPDPSLRPGERVAVAIAAGGERDALVVPRSALLHDYHGSTWVYRAKTPSSFERRRVEVLAMEDGHAALAGDVEPGMPIVSAGAAELFGAELGYTK